MESPPRLPPRAAGFSASRCARGWFFLCRGRAVTTLQTVVKRLVLASPRGYCAGVERAVETVERALEIHGAPVYVRKQIVHNAHVVRDLERRGAVFVDNVTQVPRGSLVDVARAGGVHAYLIDNESEIDEAWLDGVESVGLTSGASAPESLVHRVIGWFRERGVSQVESLDSAFEDVFFKLPREVRADAVTRT